MDKLTYLFILIVLLTIGADYFIDNTQTHIISEGLKLFLCVILTLSLIIIGLSLFKSKHKG